MTKYDWLITATPPTPNGDLHVGHMSGPYLAADVFRRARMLLGDNSVYVCYGDDNQSYVVTTANRLEADPSVLAVKSNAEIKKTLDAYDIGMSYMRTDVSHKNAVGDTIRFLIEKGLIVEKGAVQLYDQKDGKPLYEAFSTGLCNICLLETNGGICESCGHPNDPVDLLDQDIPSRNSNTVVQKTVKRLVLPIEDYRSEIIEFYRKKRGIWRPHLIQLVDELLSKPLAEYSISHPSDWGIPIGLPQWEGQVINVWAEMGVGLLHALQQHRTDKELERGKYVQFLGYDNSYFFSIVHPTLQFALQRAGRKTTKLPEFIFTNEFYNLENRKFSTSQGHAFWGRDLLQHMTSDEARFYLSLHGPELAESNFELSAAQVVLNMELREPLSAVRKKLGMIKQVGCVHTKQVGYAVLTVIDQRFCFFCEPEHFSSHELAKILDNLLHYLAKTNLDIKDGSRVVNFLECVTFWVKKIEIFMPNLSIELANELEHVYGVQSDDVF